jgi:hypothetical protein
MTPIAALESSDSDLERNRATEINTFTGQQLRQAASLYDNIIAARTPIKGSPTHITTIPTTTARRSDGTSGPVSVSSGIWSSAQWNELHRLVRSSIAPVLYVQSKQEEDDEGVGKAIEWWPLTGSSARSHYCCSIHSSSSSLIV